MYSHGHQLYHHGTGDEVDTWVGLSDPLVAELLVLVLVYAIRVTRSGVVSGQGHVKPRNYLSKGREAHIV